MNISAIILNDKHVSDSDRIALTWSKTPKHALVLVYVPNTSPENDHAVRLFATVNHQRNDMEMAIYCATHSNDKLIFPKMEPPYIIIFKNNLLQSVYNEKIDKETVSKIIGTVLESDVKPGAPPEHLAGVPEAHAASAHAGAHAGAHAASAVSEQPEDVPATKSRTRKYSSYSDAY